MNAPASESILLDFDGFVGSLDEDRRTSIQRHLDVVPEEDREIEKKRLASMYAVAEVMDLDPADLNDQWDIVRGGFAEQQGDDWLPARDDDARFHERLVQQATQQRDERRLLFGTDSETAKADPLREVGFGFGFSGRWDMPRGGIAPQMTLSSGASVEKDREDAFRNSLVFKAQEAAYNGKGYADALAEWQATAKGKPGWKQERAVVHENIARDVFTTMEQQLLKVRPVADEAFEALAIERGVKEGEGEVRIPVEKFRGLTPQEKHLAFRLMADKAKSNPDKSRTQAFFEAVGRGAERLAVGGGAAFYRSALIERQFKAGDVVTEASADEQVRAELMREAMVHQSGGTGGGAAGLASALQGKGRKLTAEEAESWNAQLVEAREDLDTAEQLRRAGEHIVDTTRVGGTFFNKAVLPAADSLAIMGSLMIPGAWAPALELSARSYQNDEYERLRELGMEAGEANKLAAVAGTAQAALDKVQLSIFTKGLPRTFESLKRFAYMGSGGARLAANFGGTLGAETAIELTQDHIIPALVQDHLAQDPQFDVQWSKVWSDVAKAVPDTVLGMLLLSGLGGAYQTHAQGRWANYAEQLSGSAAAMRLKGYSLEQIEEIQSAPELWQKGELLKQYDPTGSPAPTGEARVALVRETAELAKKEKAAFEAKQAAEAMAATEAADYTIRVTRAQDGWQVTKGDGSVVNVSSAEAARSIREDLMQAATKEEAEAMVAIAEDWHTKTPEGVRRETTFTGETATSDGQKITYTRPGVGVVREITDARTLATLREEARMEAKATGTEAIDVVVHGSNVIEFGERLAEDVTRIVQRLEINQSDSPALTVVHERAEAVWRSGIATSAITREETQQAVASIAAAFDPEQARDAGERAFREQVQRVARGEASETELRETVSELTVAEVLGRRKDGSTMPAGSMTAAANAILLRSTDAAEVRAVGKFVAMLRGVRRYFRTLFGTVAALKKAKRDGQGQEFEALVNRLLGLDEQVAHDKAVAEEAEAIAGEAGLEYTPPTAEEMEDGIAFSLTVPREQVNQYLQSVSVPASAIESASNEIESSIGAVQRIRENGADDLFAWARRTEASRGVSRDGTGSGVPAERAENSAISRVLDPAAIGAALRERGTVSSIIPRLLSREIPGFDIAGQVIARPSDFAALLMPLRSPFFESLKVAFVDAQDRVIHSQVLHVGSLNESVASPRDILNALQDAQRKNPAVTGVLISHNHPSGDPNPSMADRKITEKISDAVEAAGLRLVDHVITNGTRYYSFKEQAEGAIPDSRLAEWEVVPRGELVPVDSPEKFQQVVASLRQGVGKEVAHVVYLNTKMRVTAVERMSSNLEKAEAAKTIANGIGREVPYGIMLDVSGLETSEARAFVKEAQRVASAVGIKLLDASSKGNASWSESGLIMEEGMTFSLGRTEVRRTPETRAFPTQDRVLIGPATFSIRAFHGTPHKVDRFATDKIGTGEGAQAYGWGLYFAENRAVAQNYAEMVQAEHWVNTETGERFTPNMTEGHAGMLAAYALNRENGDTAKARALVDAEMKRAVARAEADLENWRKRNAVTMIPIGERNLAGAQAVHAEALRLIDTGALSKSEGRLYTVTLDVNEEDLLDWGKPMSEQSEKVKAALKQYLSAEPGWTGEQVYVAARGRRGGRTQEAARTTSDWLRSLGIQGIRFADAGSRDGKGETHNIVMFDDALIQITEENGQPVDLSAPTQEEVEDGIAFRLTEAPKMDQGGLTFAVARADIDHNRRLRAKAGFQERMRDEYIGKPASDNILYRSGRMYRAIGEEGLADFRETGVLRPRVSGKGYEAVYTSQGATGSRYDASAVVEIDPAAVGEWTEGTGGYWTTPLDSIRWDSPGVRVFQRQGNGSYSVVHDNIGDEALREDAAPEGGSTFRVSAGSRLEVIQKQLDAALARDPKKRRELGRLASSKLQRLQFELETERFTPQGDRIRPVTEKRSAAELDKEQAFRQASRADELITEGMGTLSPEAIAAYERGVDKLEDHPLIATMLGDHGKLISKATAARRGLYGEYDGVPWLPPSWYAGPGKGGLMPNEMAQGLYESGLLREPSPDALWQALASAIETHRKTSESFEAATRAVRDIEKHARDQAREEAFEWRQEQDRMQREDWNFKTSLIRDLRTLEALASVLPAEVRGKLGGFTKLAQLTSNEARLAEIQRRVKKMAILVEQHLQTESVAELESLLEKAKPKGGPGEKPGGKIGVQGHRIFAEVGRIWQMSTEQAEAERAALTAAIEAEAAKSKPGEVNLALLDLLEREQIFDSFAAFEEKSAAEMDKAVRWLEEVYTTGRNAWRAIEEQRAAEVASMQAQVIEAMGEGAASLANRQQQKAAEAQAAKLLENGSLDLVSFVQVLESLLAPGHPIVTRWNRAARKATAQKTDAILAANARFQATARAAMGGVSTIAMQRRLWTMATEQTIEISKREGVTSETIEVPKEKVEQIRDGTVMPDAFGLSQTEADDLIDQLNDPDNALKKNLSVERVNPGEVVPAKITEGEAIALTMLARQEQYAANLSRHGYTADVLAEAEAGISAEGRALREFFAKEYRENYEPMARLFREMFGIDLPQIPNYSPATFHHAGKERDMDPFGGGLLAEGGFRAGFLKERKAHLAEPRLESAFSIWRGHVAQTEHWQAFAPFVRELKGVLGNVNVKNAIQGKHGADMTGALQRWMQAFEQNGLHERSLGRATDSFFREMTRRQATLTLAWRGGTVLKQSLALIASGMRMPTGAWLRGFSRVMRGKVDVKAIRESAMIQRRIQSGYSPEVRAAMASLFNGAPTAFRNFTARGLETLAEVDGFFAAIGTAISYDYHFSEGIKAGLSEELAREQALVEAEDNLGRTAQPTEMMDRSLTELAMSPLERVGFMFASNQRMLTAHIISAAKLWKAGKMSAGDMTRVLMVGWLASGLGSALIGAGWRDLQDDDDDEWLDWDHWNPLDMAKATLLGPLGGIPLLNILASGLQGFSNSGPFQPVIRGINGASKITEGDKAEPVEKTLNRVIDVANGAAVLIPQVEAVAVGGNIFKQVRNLVDNFAPDTETEKAAKERRRAARERKEALENDK